MFDALKKRLKDFLDSKVLEDDIAPQTFLELSNELLELADAASNFWHNEPQFQQRVQRIRTEMEQLESLASKPEFKRLSPQKRLELRESLLASREQLLEAMGTVPAPTSTLQ
ncbi:hypothetical protein [Desulfobaculum bizertense]|uniref:Uncharacterized protein n=1 Tax=Desulfobaculum bizertense DSM 18034 TaxID=1121442 RepID=A0A1T4VWC7_9BACT|nr:hypothetical protein [Desulfobaculum bizertense]UIJ36764.1 hypothetical protein LWC08_08425 [Desulfobaculum bizertense]SKA69209.1 hypothetical protein SAMN02745702_01064 [Desulfobaculum bizertense DSM 18034]